MSTEHTGLEQLRKALDGYARMVLHVDANNVLLWVNGAARRRLRAETVMGKIVGRSMVTLTPSLSQGPLESVLEAARASGITQSFQQSYPSGLLVDFSVLPADGEVLLIADDVSPDGLQASAAGPITTVLEASLGEMWIFDPENDTVARWAKHPTGGQGERVVQSWAEAHGGVPEGERQRIRQRQQESLRTGVPFDVSHSTGSGLMARQLQVRGTRVQLEGRAHLMGMSIDVTGLHRTERAAQITHQRFLRACESLGLGLWEIDLSAGVVDLSPVTQQLFGIDRRRVQLKSVGMSSLVHPLDFTELMESWQRCADEGERYEVQFRARSGVGERWRWLSSVGERVLGQGKDARIGGWTRDVTEERRLSDLHEVAERVALTGGWLLDVSTSEVFWTAGMYRLLGWDPSEGGPARDDIVRLHAPEDRERVQALFQRGVQEGAPYEYEATVLRKDGERRRVHVRGEPALHNGVVFQVVGAMQDITERAQLETELRRSQRLDSLGRMAGGVAHDFNNVLAAISGNAELLLDVGEVAEVQELAEEVLLATGRGTSLTKQMLGFARNGSAQPKQGSTEVGASTGQVVGMLNRLLPTTVQLEVHLPDRPLYVALDDGRYEQIVMNLVLNGRDALEGAGTVRVRVELVESPASELSAWVRLSVEDDGAGMSPETQEHMFEPFFTTRPGAGGTGLGLATVYRVLKAAGGRLTVRSEVDVGTVIEAYIPVAGPPLPASASLMVGAVAARGCSILVAEDDDVVRRMVSRVLLRAGYEVTAVADGAAAFALTNEQGLPDLVVTDIDMPGLTGVELSVLLRARRADLPLVFLSSHAASALAFDDDQVRSFTKPFKVEALERAVTELLTPSAQRRSK